MMSEFSVIPDDVRVLFRYSLYISLVLLQRLRILLDGESVDFFTKQLLAYRTDFQPLFLRLEDLSAAVHPGIFIEL